MDKNKMKEIILDYINKNDSASYAEVEWLFQQNGYDYHCLLYTSPSPRD